MKMGILCVSTSKPPTEPQKGASIPGHSSTEHNSDAIAQEILGVIVP